MTNTKDIVSNSKKIVSRHLHRKAIRKAAIKYTRLKFSVVVLHGVVDGKCTCVRPNCTSPGKHPITAHGVKDATKNVQTIKRLLDKHPDANLGLATGHEAGLIVLDVDPRHGGNETVKSLLPSLGRFPIGPKSLTGDGWHRYFRAPEKPVRRDTTGRVFGPGVDVIGEDSYVVVPPSIHISGKIYKWVKGRSLLDGVKPPQLPGGWRKRLLTTTGKTKAAVVRGNGVQQKFTQVHPPAQESTTVTPLTSEVGVTGQSKISEGQRNTTLTRVGGYLITTGLTDQAVLQCLLRVNQTRCVPPLDESEVKIIADSVTKYRPAHIQTTHESPEYVGLAMAMAENFAGGNHLRYIPKHGFHVYDGKKWAVEEVYAIEQMVLATLEKLPVGGRRILAWLSEVIRLLSIKQTAPKESLYSDAAQPILNCANGELWFAEVGTVTLKPHSPDSNLMHCLPIVYDPKAKCPEYDKAVLQIFGDATDPKDMVRHWNEVAGYLIQATRNIPLILMLLGGGSNGKTELWMTLVELIGENNIYSGSLGQIESDRFLIGFLRGKLMFVDDDIKAGQKIPDGAIKKISESKWLSGQLKGRDAFQFRNRALPVLLCNNEPSTADISKGMRRRVMVIPFKHEFKVGKDLDRSLWPRIRRNELPGILNRLIEGLQRLRKRGKWKSPVDVRQAKREWFQNANPLLGFMAERTRRDGTNKCLLSEFYLAYKAWTDDNGITYVLQRNTLGRQLKQLGYNVRHTNGGMAVIGLALKKKGFGQH